MIKNIQEEGRDSFIMGEKEEACKYTDSDKQREWKIGYYKEELDELYEEQDNQLFKLDIRYNIPFTGLEPYIRELENTIEELEESS